MSEFVSMERILSIEKIILGEFDKIPESSDKKNKQDYIQYVFGLIKKDPVEIDLQDLTDINMLKPKIELYDTLRHIKTGRIGVYVEHVNCGEGYMISTDDGKIPRILAGEYNDFELLEEEKP